MVGGLIALIVAGDLQDVFFTACPQITFYKSVYRKHGNYGIETRVIPSDDTTLK